MKTNKQFRWLSRIYRQFVRNRPGATHAETLAWIAQWSQDDADLLAIIYADRA